VKRLSGLVFLPAPRTVRDAAGAFVFSREIDVDLRGDSAVLLPHARRLREGCRRAFGRESAAAVPPLSRDAGRIVLALDDGTDRQEYLIRVAPGLLEVRASSGQGLFHGITTLLQAAEQCGGRVPAGEVIDRPDFPVRGAMLDVSRCKVPTMETLFSLVDMFASLKLNHLQLYTEHTFAYAGHEEVWAGASPLTAAEIGRLDTYCRERFIELAPNQNSFGHMTRWLVHPRYRGLAECLEGFDWPWGGRSSEPFSLAPGHPGSLALLEDLYDQLLPCFSSRLFNVGCDETFDVGQGQSREACARQGRGRVYLDFLLKVHEQVRRRGRTMMFWGDMIMEHPDLVPELPRDTVALEWGYEADHPFAEHGVRFAGSGVPFWVCPGTSSWNSLAGRTENCLANIRSAAEGGLANGAGGLLVTDWGDNGHWQALPVSYVGLAAAAAHAWCLASNRGLDLAPGLDMHVYRDRAAVMGRLSLELGNAYRLAGGRLHNQSRLFQVLRSAPGSALPDTVTAESLRETGEFVQAAAAPLDDARMDRADAALVHDEYANTVRLLLLACARDSGETARSSPAGRPGISPDPRRILAEYERLWLARNRPGGLDESRRLLAEAVGPLPA
jgi:hexosaminidase